MSRSRDLENDLLMHLSKAAIERIVAARKEAKELRKTHPEFKVNASDVPSLDAEQVWGGDCFSSRCIGPALHMAAKRGLTEIVEILIDKGACINLKDYHNRTPLMLAASNGKADCVEILLKAQADINIKTGWFFGNTALEIATQEGHFNCAKLLLEAQKSKKTSPHRGFFQFGSAGQSIQISNNKEPEQQNRLKAG